MGRLNLATPFEVLTELRKVLTVQEIAEATGLRRETISRARPDSRFQRRTVKALDDLHLVVTRLRPMLGDDVTHLSAVLLRPQAVLGHRSIAELLREGRVEVALEHLAPPEPTEGERLEALRLDPAIEGELKALEERPSASPGRSTTSVDPSDLLAADPELSSRLPAVEAAIRDRFGAAARIEREVIIEPSIPHGRDVLYLRIRDDDVSLDEKIDRLTEVLGRERDLLRPVADRLTIGIL